MLDWDDLRVVLSVSRAGSTLGAARQLGLNQTTVSRRVQALEHALGLTLFLHRRTGYEPTEHGRALLAAAERVEAAAGALEADADRLRRLAAGVIRITAPEVVFAKLLAPIVVEFRRAHPGVQVEQISSESHLDLEGGEADIAFRGTADRPLGDRLIARRLPDVAWTAYCSDGYAAEHGSPACPGDLPRHAVVVYDKGLPITRLNAWMLEHVGPACVVARSNTVPNMRGLLLAGLGVGLLPCLDGDTETGLLRCFDPPPGLASTFWIVMTPEVRRVPLARRFADLAVRRLREQRQAPVAG